MPEYKSLSSLQIALRQGHVSCAEVVEQYLEKISESEDLNIFIQVYADEALERAKELDVKLATNPKSLGDLYGLVVSIKDVLCFEGHEVTAGSKILKGFISNYSATAVQRLVDADAIIIGRVNCDEFAMGSSNENSVYGPTINGIETNRIPGGSSGASAVSVQMNTCMIAIGSDTGGSVRQPAGFCGVIGLKPTYGRVSRYGLIAYGSSFDQIGILGKDLMDIAKVLETIAGNDDFDSTASPLPVPSYTSNLKKSSDKVKIAFIKNILNDLSISPDVKQVTQDFLDLQSQNGHVIEEILFELLEYAVPAYYVLTTAEASSNLARYDGIRYGFRSSKAKDIGEVYTLSRTEGFGEEVKRRILLGTFVLSSGYYDAYYGKAQKVRKLILERIETIFKEYDLLVLPVSPSVAWKIGEKSEDPIAVYLSDIFTVAANLTGIPGISIPIGQDRAGMPIGIQLMSKKFSEAELLNYAHNLLV